MSGPATAELESAIAWYDEQRGGLGSDLFDAVSETLDRIEENPALGPFTRPGRHLRRLLVDGFPYQVVYLPRAGETVIVAVAHLRRRPGYWQNRALE